MCILRQDQTAINSLQDKRNDITVTIIFGNLLTTMLIMKLSECLFLLQAPSEDRKKQKATKIFIYNNETRFKGSVT